MPQNNPKINSHLVHAGVRAFNVARRTPDHPTKSHIVVARVGDTVKTIRFGQQGVKTNQTVGQRTAFESRHRKNIARGPLSAAYWAAKVKWDPQNTQSASQRWKIGSVTKKKVRVTKIQQMQKKEKQFS